MDDNRYCVELKDVPPFSPETNQKLIDYSLGNLDKFSLYTTPLKTLDVTLDNTKKGFYGFRPKLETEIDFINQCFLEHGIQVNWEKVFPMFQRIIGGMTPHSDGNGRHFTLLYNLYGPAKTTFFKTKGTWLPYKTWPYDEIVPEESFELKLNTWYLFHTYQIHDVVLKNVDSRGALVLNVHSLFSTWEEAKANWQKVFIKY